MRNIVADGDKSQHIRPSVSFFQFPQNPTTNDPLLFTTPEPSIEESIHPSVTQSPTASSIPPSRSSLVPLSGVLNFELPMGLLSESQLVSGLGLGQVAAFEATVEIFLNREMLFFNATAIFSNFNATVVTQVFRREQPEPPSEEPIRVRKLGETSLVIVANVIALASPAEAAIAFPFQAIIQGVFLQNRDGFYDMLFSSREFVVAQEPVYVLIRGGGGNNKSMNMILGGSITGIGMVISSVIAFLLIRQRHLSQKDEEGADCVAQLSDSPQIEIGETPITHLDESSLPDDMYPNNVPHFPGDSLHSARSTATKSVAALDEWSVCDEDVMHSSHLMPHSPITDSNVTLTASTFELAEDIYAMNDSMLHSAQKNQNMQSQPANVFTRLYDSTEPKVSGPKPNFPRGLKLFGYFSSEKLHGSNKATDTTHKIIGNVYQVWAPPGPLGIVIASSKDGPIICKV